MLTIKTLNKKFDQRITINKGNGYFYFIFDDGKSFESESIYVHKLNNLTETQWIDLYSDFVNKIVTKNC
jgi:hypothetical protein